MALVVACNKCHRQFDPEELARVKYHPDRRCCPICGNEKQLVAFEDSLIEESYC